MERTRHFLATFLLAIALLPMTAAAAPSDTTVTVDREALLQKQMTRLLTSETPKIQERALQLLSHYAHTEQYDAAFFRPLVRPLLDVATSGSTEELQIMAISPLYTTGLPSAMEELAATLNAIQSERVQTLAKRALLQHKLDRAEISRKQLATMRQ